MKSFIYKVFWYLCPFLILGVTFEYSLRQLDNTYKFKSEYLNTNANDVELLILGSSHAYYDVNPEYFDSKAFNAGAVSQSFDLDLKILNKYKEELVNLRTIVLPVSYFTFYGKLKESPEKWRIKDYVLYYNLDIASTLKDNFEILSIKPKNNLKKLNSSILRRESKINCSTLGWGNNYRGQGLISLNNSGKEAAARHSQKDIYSQDSQRKFNEALKDLETLVSWSQQNDIQIVLFLPPGYSSYTANLNPDQLNQTKDVLEKLSYTYPNCTYVNLLTDRSFTQADFYDADHLNHQGARKLSEKLNSVIK